MEFDTVTKHGIDVPVLRNIVDIEPYTRLARYKAQEPVAAALKHALILEGGSKEALKKKARRN